MRILQLCNKFPYPPHDGGAIATINLSRAFAHEGHEVTVLAMNTSKHYFDPGDLPAGIRKEITFHSVPVDNAVKPMDALFALVRNRSYNVARFESELFEKKLAELLNTPRPFDIIQAEGIYLSSYLPVIRRHSKALVSLRAHNVEHLIWERRAAKERSYFKQRYLSILAKQLRKYETEQINEFDLLVPISEIDAAYFKRMGCKIPVGVCTASFDENVVKPSAEAPDEGTLFFIGALDWAPNVEGLEWFLREVWGKVAGKHPGVQMHVAGRNMPEHIRLMAGPDLFIHGEVEDAYRFMNQYRLMIAPLFAGSGMRVKIIEGMALGKIIITTSIGAEGIPVQTDEHLFIANSENEFAGIISRCLSEPELCKRISGNARKFAMEHFSHIAAGKNLLTFYQSHLKK